jgi:capsular exopolysaccharide synthesis family protein
MDNLHDLINTIEAEEKRKTKRFLLKYIKQWPWFVVLCILGIVIGFFNFKISPSVYEVKSRLLVKSEQSSLSDLLSFDKPGMNLGKTKNFENQIGILKSYNLFSETVKNLNRQTTWYKKELFSETELYNYSPLELIVPPDAKNAKNVLIQFTVLNSNEFLFEVKGETYMNGYLQPIKIKEVIKFGEPVKNEFFNFSINKGNGQIDDVFYLEFNNFETLTNQYLKRTTIYQEELNTDIITILIEGENIQKEADFINELNKVFINFGVASKSQNSENSIKFIDEQLERIQGSLSTSQDKYSSYRQNNQTVNLGQEAQLVYQKLEEIENEKYLTELQINFYKELLQYLDDSRKIEQMVNPSVIGITDANLNVMLAKLTELYSRREVLSYSVQDKNPSLIVLDKEIKIVRDGLEETLKNQLKATESRMASITDRYKTIEVRLRRLPETEKQMIGIRRDFDLNNEMYTYMMQKKAEAAITNASIAPEVQIIDAANPATAKFVGPSLMKNVLAGIAGGLILPLVFITLLSFFSNKIEFMEDVEQLSKIPVLEGIINHKYKELLPVIHHPRSGIAESFRGLKSNLKALLEHSGNHVVSINSLIPGEGKSFISSNFSAVLAKSGKKVLLVGADLHKPTLHKYFNLKQSFGLSEYFLNDKNLEDIISVTSVPNLHFIQAGNNAINPSDLLDNSKFEELIKTVRDMFDYIIIDNAPVLLVPDSILATGFSDVNLFVLRINHSHKDQIRQIDKIVDFNKIKNAAILVNGTPDRGYGYGKKYWKNGYGEYKQ